MIDLAALMRRRHAVANVLYLDLLGILTPALLRARIPSVPRILMRREFD